MPNEEKSRRETSDESVGKHGWTAQCHSDVTDCDSLRTLILIKPFF